MIKEIKEESWRKYVSERGERRLEDRRVYWEKLERCLGRGLGTMHDD